VLAKMTRVLPPGIKASRPFRKDKKVDGPFTEGLITDGRFTRPHVFRLGDFHLDPLGGTESQRMMPAPWTIMSSVGSLEAMLRRVVR
jgi:hypothetical protein